MTTTTKLSYLMQKDVFKKLSPAEKTALQNYHSAIVGKQQLTQNAINNIEKIYNEVKNGIQPVSTI